MKHKYIDDEESRAERVNRFSRVWWKSRADAKATQDFMAAELGVSKKTIQNWENGTSSPSFFQGVEWFRALGLSMFRYLYEYAYPSLYEKETKGTMTDEEVEASLIARIQEMGPKEQRQLFYLMNGDHGSSWPSLLQLFTAHTHVSLRSRVIDAEVIAANYNMENRLGLTINGGNGDPDMDVLAKSIHRGERAVVERKSGYIDFEED